MNEFMLVDGYNVINAWPELKNLAKESLEHARERLLATLDNYGGLSELHTIVVFDAHSVKGSAERHENYHNIEVIYSSEGETADTVIERLAYELRGKLVYVVTSDWEEQRIVFGTGANRISARQLREDVLKAVKECADGIPGSLSGRRLESRLPEEIREILESWRRAK